MAWVLCAALSPARAAVNLTVEPMHGLMDEPFHVQLRGAPPGSRVTVSAARQDAQGHPWTAVGEYSVDAGGGVDVDVSPSLRGSYTGAVPHGLWCSALPAPVDALATYVAELPQHVETGTLPNLDAAVTYPVTVTTAIDGKTVATVTATRAYGIDVGHEAVRTPDGVRGVYYFPQGAMHRTSVVVMAGSGGGIPSQQAALLASRGYPSLALGLFDYEDLPPALLDIPIERVRDGARWLKRRSGTADVAVMGTSRGSEAALLAASYFPDDIAAAIVYVPSHLSVEADVQPGVPWYVQKTGRSAWTIGGTPLPAIIFTDADEAASEAVAQTQGRHWPGYVGTPYYLPIWNDPAMSERYGIPVERMSGPVLALAAGADEMWPSFIGAVQIQRRLAVHGKADAAEVHIYPGAGHLISRLGVGNELSSGLYHPVAKAFMAVGGLPNANCEASYAAWNAVLEFLRVKVGRQDPRDSHDGH